MVLAALRFHVTLFAILIAHSTFAQQVSPAKFLGDLDGDKKVTVFDLTRLQMHLSGSPALSLALQLSADLDQDGLVTENDVEAVADTIMGLRQLREVPPARVLSTSPGFGEGNVALTRETIVRFTQPLAATNAITTNTLSATFGGRRILSRTEFAGDRRALTLFYLEPLPASARLRVTINGDALASILGTSVDGDANGTPGGVGILEFDTASITPVPGTAVIGTVYASELAPGTNGLTNSVNVPLAGVTITVDGAEQNLRTVTDSNGVFTLSPCPSGRFFVHVDGRTVTDVPAGIRYPDMAYYPVVGKAWEAIPGVMTNLAGGNGLIYLPLIPAGTLQNVSLVSNTPVTFPPGVVSSNPALAGVVLNVPAGALYDDAGIRGGKVGIAPVAPDRLPEPLPPGLGFALVITVQTDGPSNFGEPVPVCFPNLPDPETGELLAPGAKSALWSFNHDTGRWEMQGPMTITADGRFACTDPGVGIQQPGWHGSFPGSPGGGDPPGGGGDHCPTGCGCEPKGGGGPPDKCEDKPPDLPSCEGTDDTNPVLLFSGEKLESAVDLRIKGVGIDFVWSRTYRSKQGLNTVQGNGWDFSYNMAVALDGRGMRVLDGRARAELYHPNTTGTWGRKGYARQLSLDEGGVSTLLFNNKKQLRFFSLGSSPQAGKVQTISDRNGNTLRFTYDAQGRLIKVTDTLDRDIYIAYNADNFIESVTDFAGRSVRYTYYGHGEPGGSFGDLKSVTTPAVIGTPNGNDFPNGKTTTYTYTSGYSDERLNHNLLTITDGRRNDPNDPTFGAGPYLQSVYSGATDPDDPNFDRVIRQIRGGSIIDLTYIPQRATATNDWIYMRTLVRNGVGNVSEFLYRVSNLLVRERHYTGRSVTNVPVTEASNRPASKLRPDDPDYFETRYEYNDDFALTRTIHPNGNITENVYESDLNPSAPPRTRRNLRMVRHLPGSHQPAGDQAVIEEQFEYDGTFGCTSCGASFVTKHSDGRGNSVLSQYDDRGNLVARTNRIASAVENWEYNDRGQMTKRIHPDNGSGHRRVDVMTYYDFGPMKGYVRDKVVDFGGFNLTTRFEYDLVGNVVRKISPRGHDALYAVNALDQVVRETSPEIVDGSGVRYTKDYFYDANNNLVRVETQNRRALVTGLASSLSPSIQEADGAVVAANPTWTTRFEYEILNKLIRKSEEVEPDRFITTEYAYDANRNKVLTRFGEAVAGRQPHNAIQHIYDERNLLFREIRAPGSPDQSSTQFDYDGNKNRIRTRDGLEDHPHLTTYEFDAFDRLVSSTDAMGNVTSHNYDGSGNRVHTLVHGEAEDVAGSANNVRLSETFFTYDAMNRLTNQAAALFDTTTQAPIGDGFAKTESIYSDNSQILAVVNQNGHGRTNRYDTVNRLVKVRDAKENTVDFDYDANGRITTESSIETADLPEPHQRFTAGMTYDNLGRQISATDTAGNCVQFCYNSRNNVTIRIDANTNVTRYAFDGLNRLTETRRILTDNGLGSGTPTGVIVLRQEWDASSRVISQTDDNQNATIYSYDNLNRRISTTYADGVFSESVYDVHSNRIQSNDANGTVVRSTFDELNRATERRVNAAPGVSGTTFESLRYDGLSRLVDVIDDDSFVHRSYDSLSRILREHQSGQTVVCSYDPVGNKTRIIYPDGRTLQYHYDELERLRLVSDQQGIVARYSYVGPSRMLQVDYGNGTRKTLKYDGITGVPSAPGDLGAMQIVRLTHATTNGIVLEDRAYRWSRTQARIEDTDLLAGAPQMTRHYTYDSIDRMIRSDAILGGKLPQTISYVLDGVGNRVAVGGGVNAGSYAMNSTIPEPADYQVNQYTSTPVDVREYDRNGNVIVMQPMGARLTFDYRNQLVKYSNSVSGVFVAYSYDVLGRRIAKHLQNLSATVTRYVYDDWQEVMEEDEATGSIATYVYGTKLDELLNRRTPSMDLYYHSDDINSVLAVSGPNGTLLARYEYSDFGVPTVSGSLENSLMFTGRRYDSESGLYYVRNRYLDPTVGRFITRDPLGVWGDHSNLGNATSYVGNNPSTLIDPTGLGVCEDAKRQGLDLGPDGKSDAGGVICKDGIETPCVWGVEKVLGVTSRIKALMANCVLGHEQMHVDDPNCPCPKNCELGRLYRQGCYSKQDLDNSECDAYTYELFCLQNIIPPSCPRNGQDMCLTDWNYFLQDTEGMKDRHCARR